MTKTVCVDFDGVLHSYIQPWTRPDVIKDKPVLGAIEWLNHLDGSDYTVVIQSTRATESAGLSAIRNWLIKYGYNRAMDVDISPYKVPAIVYVDDRGWHFDGFNFPTLRELSNFKPWNAEQRETARERGA